MKERIKKKGSYGDLFEQTVCFACSGIFAERVIQKAESKHYLDVVDYIPGMWICWGTCWMLWTMNVPTDISRLSENGHPLPLYKYINMNKSGYVQSSVQGEIYSQIQLLQIYLRIFELEVSGKYFL